VKNGARERTAVAENILYSIHADHAFAQLPIQFSNSHTTKHRFAISRRDAPEVCQEHPP
jgi:hypothetical protein